MLRKILQSTGIPPETCAGLLGINRQLFSEWVAGQRPIPESIVGPLSTILGVPPRLITTTAKEIARGDTGELVPAIWYKLRGDEFFPADRECVLLIRQVAHNVNELEEVTGRCAVGWKPLFEAIRRRVDGQTPPNMQGREAARLFRESTGLAHGARGVSDVFRGSLRSLGVLVIESPIPESQLEGCAFYVGPRESSRPCVFANSHHSTWFRRNGAILHEVGHAVFDADRDGASLDLEDKEGDALCEKRAQAFARDVLIPKDVLRHIANSTGIVWGRLGPGDLAALVAKTGAEKRMVLDAAAEAGYLDIEAAEALQQTDISQLLPSLTDRALSTEEYLLKRGEVRPPLVGHRTTTIPSRTLQLPVGLVTSVIEATSSGEISRSKAAELLMIDQGTFERRFAAVLPADEE